MEGNKKKIIRKTVSRRIFATLLAVKVLFSGMGAMPVMAGNVSTQNEESDFIRRKTSMDGAGIRAVDLSMEAIKEAEVSKEELMQEFSLNEMEVEASDANFMAECVTMPVAGADKESSVSENGTDISADMAVYAAPEDAADYLREKLTQRKELITVKVSKVSNIKNYDASDYAYAIIQAALAYDINGEPDEGDYIRYHMSRLAWQGQKGSDSYTLRFAFTYLTTASEEKFVNNKIKSIVKSLNLKSESLNDYEKVRLIYDYIMSTVAYDYFHYNTNLNYTYMYTTYEALATGSAVCQAYATLFYRLCEEAGISARVIPGNGTTHGWNIVKIGNSYYNVDATWDDGDTPSHYYFLKSEEEFYDHVRDQDFETTEFHKQFPMSPISYRLPERDSSSILIEKPNLTLSLNLIDGTAYSLYGTGKPKIIFFLNAGENSVAPTMLSAFYNLTELKGGGFEGVIVDVFDGYNNPTVQQTPASVMMDIRSRTDNSGYYRYSSALGVGMNYKKQYAALAGKAQSEASAVVVIDGADKVRYYGEGIDAVSSLETILSDILDESTMRTIGGLQAVQTLNNQVKLSWTPVGDSVRYLVYRKIQGGNYYCLLSTTATSVTDEVAADRTYIYKVCAISGKRKIAQSAEVTVATRWIWPKKGKCYAVEGKKYKVLTSSTKSKTVAFKGVTNKNLTRVEIPATVKIHGISYRVTEVAANALKNKKKLKAVVIGKNVTKIGKKAFAGSKKLVNLSVKSKKLKKVEADALKGISGRAEIRVPSAKYAGYKKLFAGKGQKDTVKIKK